MDSLLSLFNSEPVFGEDDLMSLTPPHDMDDEDLLFPDLKDMCNSSDATEQKPATLTTKTDPKVVCINLNPGQESELEEYLAGKLGKTSPVNVTPITKADQTSHPLIVKRVAKVAVVPQISPPQRYYNPPSPTSSVGTDLSDYRSNPNKCMTKSAIAARENRQRKKEYVENLENSVDRLSKENVKLKSVNEGLSTAVTSLRTEVQYLKSVLANQSTLATLLKNIPGTPGVTLRSSELEYEDEEVEVEEPVGRSSRSKKAAGRGGKRKAADDNTSHGKKAKASAGICLHVSKDEVSLEFCASCSDKAGKARV